MTAVVLLVALLVGCAIAGVAWVIEGPPWPPEEKEPTTYDPKETPGVT